jgi:glycosyltransferase involved in cell wall biosynthesis
MDHVENKKLFIAGEGPDLDKLRRIVSSKSLEKKVFFLGKIDRHESIKLMTECDAFVFPSLRDSASWALAEAVTLKCRVIALDLPGIRAITDGTGIELVALHGRHLAKRVAIEIMKSENANSGNRRFDLEDLSNKIENSIIENL